MNILTGAAAGTVVVLAYFLGVVTGTRFLCPQCRGYSCGKDWHTVSEKNDSVAKAESDQEKQRQYEEDQKAFTDCMSYSAVQAYERKPS